jgi:nucleoside-diphosphate-sugar epimerase
MRYVVAGVGYTGRRVLAALPDGSASGLGRSAQDLPAVQCVDLDADALPRLTLPADYVLLYTIPPPHASRDARLERLLGALEPRPQRIVYLSTSGVYGDRGGALTPESAPLDPGNERSRRRVAAEKMLQQWCSKNSCELVVLRVAAIYGPDRLGLARILTTMPVLAEGEANPGNRIHVDDLVKCCIAAMDCTNPEGTYNVSDGDYRSATWFAKRVARLSGLAEPPEVSRLEAERTFPARRLSFLAESRRLDITRMRDILGVQPRDPETGIRQSL